MATNIRLFALYNSLLPDSPCPYQKRYINVLIHMYSVSVLGAASISGGTRWHTSGFNLHSYSRIQSGVENRITRS